MLENYSGATRIIPILGHPIEQVKSPNGLTRAFEARGCDTIVVPLDVTPDFVKSLLAALDSVGNLGGIIATVPHKFAAFTHAATATKRARFFGSANILRRDPDQRWHADMLDGLAFIQAISAARGNIAGSKALLIGAGGAGSAIGLELLNAGAATLAVYDTDEVRKTTLLRKLDETHLGKSRIGSTDPTGFDLVVNATPLGMRPQDPPPLQLEKLDANMLVGDVVTAPVVTPLLDAATAVGCATCSGHDMFKQSVDLMLDFLIDAPS